MPEVKKDVTLLQIVEDLEEYQRRRPDPVVDWNGLTPAENVWRFIREGWSDGDIAMMQENDPDVTRESLLTMPFFSEVVLYALLGKDDARTVLALLNKAIGRPTDYTYRSI